jgi:3-deoxy-manno-octulosonate cytidylyltransferase (CMP-KDO synthetase)
MHCVVAVPARLESSRLPGKVMADIGGKPMLQRVLEACSQAKTPQAVVLCTDSQDLYHRGEEWGFKCIQTSRDCESGSDRLASVTEQLVHIGGGGIHNTLIINAQGDQPFLDPAVIDALATEFASRSPTPQVITPVYRMKPEKIHNPNVVKTLLASNGRALYFSRSAIPHVRGADPEDWPDHATYWGHVGIYGYRADVLLAWNRLPFSPLEQCEKLEQLRLIEAGIEISTLTVDAETLSVDTAEQLEEARRIARNQS